MNKFNLILSFCLIFVLFSSCAPDYTDVIELAYDDASRSNSDSGSGSSSSSDSCTTIDGNMWSSKSSDKMKWRDAVSYCNHLTVCGYSDWHLPTISELRTLIKNCSGTVTGGSCGVTDNCLSSSECRNDACSGCDYDSNVKYSKLGDIGWFWSSSTLSYGEARLRAVPLGDTGWFWSSSTRSDSSGYAWRVNFSYGRVYSNDKDDSNGYVRCVR